MTYIRNCSLLLPSHEPDDPKYDEASEDTRYTVADGHNDSIPKVFAFSFSKICIFKEQGFI